MNRIERIQAMEAILDEAGDAVEALANALEDYAAMQARLRKLSAYYGGEHWYADLDADTQGKLPDDLKRGVLSEDLVYDVLTGNRDNAIRMLELATEILKDQ